MSCIKNSTKSPMRTGWALRLIVMVEMFPVRDHANKLDEADEGKQAHADGRKSVHRSRWSGSSNYW